MIPSVSFDKHWWDPSLEGDPSRPLWGAWNRLEPTREQRLDKWRRLLGEFYNWGIGELAPGGRQTDQPLFRALTDEKELRINPAANCIESLAARIASQRPYMEFLPTTSDPKRVWPLREAAEDMRRGVAGEWHHNRVYRKTVRTFLYSAVIGFGATHVTPASGRIQYESVPPWELDVDVDAAQVADPRVMFRCKWVAAEVLKGMFEDRKDREAIDRAVRSKYEFVKTVGTEATITDLVPCLMGWHLESVPGAGDGLYVMSVPDHTLNKTSWPHDRLPFAFLPWHEPLIGWFPQGLIERQLSTQRVVNKLLLRVQEAAHLYANMKTYYEEGSISEEQLRNCTGDMVPYKRGQQPPKAAWPPSIPSDIVRFVWDLVGKIYENEGVSQISAAARLPAQVESGRAIMTLQDVETGRHALLNLALEDYYTDLAELTIMAAKEIGSGYKSRYPDRHGFREVDWGKTLSTLDTWEIRCWPTNLLPNTPAGLIKRLQELSQMLPEVFTGKVLMQLIRVPGDQERVLSLETASLDDVDYIVAKMLAEGEYIEPEPYQDLGVMLERMVSIRLRARQEGVPKDGLELLDKWIRAADELANPPQPPMGPPGEVPAPDMGQPGMQMPELPGPMGPAGEGF